jgi:hypothetical protein
MISVDLRTRTDDMIEPVDPTGFFGNDLPALIERHGRLAVPGAAELSPRPLAFTVGDRTPRSRARCSATSGSCASATSPPTATAPARRTSAPT